MGDRGADDETRTRDPHLGKVMRYQLRYIRMQLAAARTNSSLPKRIPTNRQVRRITWLQFLFCGDGVVHFNGA